MNFFRTIGELFDIWIVAILFVDVIVFSYLILRFGRDSGTRMEIPKGPSLD